MVRTERSAPSASGSHEPSRPGGGRWAVWLLAGAALIAIASPQHYRDDIRTANEAARVYATRAIVYHGTVALDPVFDHDSPGWRKRPGPPNVDVAYRDGHYYLDKGPGITLLAVPVAGLLRLFGVSLGYADLAWLFTLLLCAVPLAGLLVGLARWLRASFGDRSPAPLAAVALVLCSPLLVYGDLLFGHALAAVLVGAGAIVGLGGLGAGPAPGRRSAVAGGALLGAAVLVEYPAALAVLLCLAGLAIDRSRRARLPWLLAGGAVPALVLMAWNTINFGGPLALSYAYKANPAMAAVHSVGVYGIGWPDLGALWGLLVGARRGLFFLAPWLLLGVAGAVWVVRDREVAPAWRLVLPGAVVSIPLVISGFVDWEGGRAMGPRYLLFGLALWAIAAAYALDRWRRRGARVEYGYAVLAGLAASSFLVQLIGAYVFPYLSDRLANPLFEVDVPVLLSGGPCPTAWDSLVPSPVGMVIGWVAGAAVLAVAVWQVARRMGARVSRQNLLLGLLAIAVGTAHLAVAASVESPASARREVTRERQFTHMVLGHEQKLPTSAAHPPHQRDPAAGE